MTHTLGIGVIGMGWMGEVHSRSYRQVIDRFYDSGIKARLVICSDNVEARAQTAKERLGFEQYTTDWQEVVDHPDVDVVNVAAPNGLHLEMVQAAAKAGKHIFCEKPVGKDPQETAQCEYAARKAGVQTFVGYNYRWPPMVQYATQLIEQGQLGRLTHYRSRYLACYASNPYGLLSWRFLEENGVGILGDLGSHAIDMAHLIVGPIKKVVANRETFIRQRPLAQPGKGTHFSVGGPDDPMGDVTNEDYVGVLVSFENGVQGTIETCRVINGPKAEYTFELNGTEGAIKWDFERMNELKVQKRTDDANDGYTTLLGGPDHPFHSRFNPGPGIGIGYEDLKVIEAFQFLKSIVDGKQRQPGFADALAVANVQTAIQRSWESERWETVESIRIA
ncbi:MAG: Gfo/Idh/MocA family oxidoreductase [Chloroflexota bacterium]